MRSVNFKTNLKGYNELKIGRHNLMLSDEECQQIVDKIKASGLLGDENEN